MRAGAARAAGGVRGERETRGPAALAAVLRVRRGRRGDGESAVRVFGPRGGLLGVAGGAAQESCVFDACGRRAGGASVAVCDGEAGGAEWNERVVCICGGAVGERLREDEKGDVDEEGEDFLAKMVRMHRREPEKFGFLDMMMVCAMNVGAGSDSTSVALSAVMWFLLKNPPVMAKARSYSTLEVCMMLT